MKSVMIALSTEVLTIEYEAPEVNLDEVRRYARMKARDGLGDRPGVGSGAVPGRIVESLLSEMLDEILPLLSYKVAYRYIEDEDAIYFGATIGIEIDRIINKYGRISPARALIAQGIGAERIESLCDAFESDVLESLSGVGISGMKSSEAKLLGLGPSDASLSGAGIKAKRRVSPGYGDFPLESQKYIFDILDLPRKIGLTLNESLMMSPSKSVTAKIQLLDFSNQTSCGTSSCITCNMQDCVYRKVCQGDGSSGTK